MTPELEQLLKAWDAYLQEPKGPEADRLLALFESRLEDYSATSRLNRDVLLRAIKWKYSRWRRATDPGFPRLPPKA
jgi:hypothetical protein